MLTKLCCEQEQDEIGHRLLLNYIDKWALINPEKIAFYQVILDSPQDKVVPLKYAHLRNLVDQLAWWIHGLSGNKCTYKERSIAYLAPSDLRHLLLALACNRIGSKALLLSSRNSAYINAHLIDECGCELLIFDATCSHVADQISAKSKITLHGMNDLVDLLKTKNARSKDFPYYETWASAYNKPALILQTSGSTGLSKRVPISHSAISTIDIQQSVSKQYTDGRKCHLEVLAEAKRPYQSFPLFHVAGFELTCLFLFTGRCVVLGPPRRPPGIEVYKKVVELARPDAAMLAPQTLNEIAEDPPLMSAVVPKLEWIMYGGGPITEKTGDAVSSRTRLMNGFGSTECGSMPLYPTDAPYWNCYHFHPLSGADLRPIPNSDGLYELFVVRDETSFPYQSIFHNFPDLHEFPVKDIFQRHPDNENYWVYQGRTDDILVLSTGEKINPLPVQDAVSAIPGVRSALVVGNKQPYPGLLIELGFDAIFPEAKELIMSRLDKTLADTNFQGSRDAHIQLKDVIWAGPEKPLARNAKGNLRRSAIEKDYEDEINRLYGNDDSLISELDPSSEQTLFSGLLEMAGQLVSIDDLDIDEDLFDSGLDSRGAQILVNAINRASPHEEKAHVLLTGSTGFVGSYVLDSLLRCPEVERIACLDRWTEYRAASSDTNTTNNPVDVQYLLGSLERENFNLDPSVLSTLLESITVIVHCQWPVNFNQPLSSFEPNIEGVENLIRFAHGASYNPPIVFLSSIATVKQWDKSIPVPEKPLSDPKHAQTWYGQSKLLASVLLEEAGKTLGTRSSICRLGQVAGPVGRVVKQRMWPRTDWFPSLLETSRAIGCVPDSLGSAGRVDWLPVDKLAEIIVQLVVLKHSIDANGMALTDFHHLVNAEPVSYQDILPVIVKRLGEEVRVVSLSEWVDRLEKSAATTENGSNPGLGLGLLSFFQGLKATQEEAPVVLDTQHTQDRLPLLGEIGAANGSWMEMWLDQWDFNSRN
ncbi:acetyl-CoA synthetase-like protein [Aspergillus steynii IBT 23096]|uniref:Acetyl-CoA synthetase-like protein n=1 Tax=Aspergillus steynii IBT 23096 TaxID=1392250 RepID=A0A2I2GAA1_9EURO|nr:acetyl-CoA synthetase-like protein [Aspergillus steynii IBT 23096]PLB49801.1 acetyl-CoA synthetase-like protein [Aspergillus steynii IBT 23096]